VITSLAALSIQQFLKLDSTRIVPALKIAVPHLRESTSMPGEFEDEGAGETLLQASRALKARRCK
jgi:hypothetical protein